VVWNFRQKTWSAGGGRKSGLSQKDKRFCAKSDFQCNPTRLGWRENSLESHDEKEGLEGFRLQPSMR
jgi:hypothetical protein